MRMAIGKWLATEESEGQYHGGVSSMEDSLGINESHVHARPVLLGHQ